MTIGIAFWLILYLEMSISITLGVDSLIVWNSDSDFTNTVPTINHVFLCEYA